MIYLTQQIYLILVSIADFNNDGWLDLVFAAEDDENHEFYLNRDGFQDLVLAHMGRVQPSVLLNDGKGKFKVSNELLPSIPGNYISIISADFDKNGSQDLYFGGFMTDDKLLLRK